MAVVASWAAAVGCSDTGSPDAGSDASLQVDGGDPEPPDGGGSDAGCFGTCGEYPCGRETCEASSGCCTSTADCCPGAGCYFPPGASSGTCIRIALCAWEAQPCSPASLCCYEGTALACATSSGAQCPGEDAGCTCGRQLPASCPNLGQACSPANRCCEGMGLLCLTPAFLPCSGENEDCTCALDF